MTLLSCFVIGLAFLLAVGLLIFAAALLGWYVPGIIERARRGDGTPDSAESGPSGPAVIDPPGPRA